LQRDHRETQWESEDSFGTLYTHQIKGLI
jgi:hypothetical protein